MSAQGDHPRSPLDGLAAKLRLPFGTPDFIDRIIQGATAEAGRRTLQILFTTWDQAGGGPFAASAAGAAGASKATDLIQSQVAPIFERLLSALGADDVMFRAQLCASQLVGVGMIRYGVRSDPIASMDRDRLVDALAPTMQRYLTGELK
ncbi:hypothetical protein FOS14_07085 [Skermania sp. ID1734]|uniref:TetR/AcrR family transcriptional regulator n=1 Tax=Skermania sp. ID1734 TaxID=2597516 RepID=UPI00117EDF67|nr:hypothetical protein [Skermania sp. ID1734]TSE00767.1 hypothetical protein FOS14_07085 [Skermania sp. ID1734]